MLAVYGGLLSVFLRILSLLAIPVGLVLVIVGLVRYLSPPPFDSAEVILRRRYAQGEISLSEYRQLLLDIGAKGESDHDQPPSR